MQHFKRRGLLYLALRQGGFWLVLPIVLGGIAGAIGFGMLGDAGQFSERGEVASGTITSTSVREMRSPGSGNISRVPTASVRFTVDGKEIVASARIGQELFDSEPAGQEISLLYLPDDPTRVEIEQGRNLRDGLILSGVLAVVMLFWLVIVVRALRYARRALYVRDRGTLTTVSVIEHQSPMFTSDKDPETCLVWSDSSGRACRSLPMKGSHAREYRVGSKIQIFEIPGSELDSVWEGDVGHPVLNSE